MRQMREAGWRNLRCCLRGCESHYRAWCGCWKSPFLVCRAWVTRKPRHSRRPSFQRCPCTPARNLQWSLSPAERVSDKKLPYLEKLLHHVVIDFVFLFTLIVLQLLQVCWQVFAVPRVLLNFMYFYAFHGVWLKHPVDQVSDIARYVVRQEKPAFADLLKQDGQLVVVKR